MLRKFGGRALIVVAACYALLTAPLAWAVPASSNYRLDEESLGSNSNLESKSANFGVTEALGDVGVGNTKSANFQVNAGSRTTGDPALGFSVTAISGDFGRVNPTATATARASFTVINYTTYGYVVQVTGGSPKSGSHTIAPLATPSSPQAGVEQFGLNLVANTDPVTFGAIPDNGSFGFGSIMPNYAIANKYTYIDGDVIAQAAKDSGTTNYTLSYILNVAGLTPGGTYTSAQSLVVTGTY